MWLTITKVLVAAGAITFTSWLAGKKPTLAGFIIAMPLASLLALAFSYIEHRDASASITFAKSIMIGVPVSYLFFLPFFLADRWNLGFWMSYLSGLALLCLGYFLHRWITSLF